MEPANGHGSFESSKRLSSGLLRGFIWGVNVVYSIYSTQSQPHTSATHPYPSADSSGSYQRSQTPDPKPKAAPYTHKPKIIDLIWSDLSPNKPPQPSSLPAFRIYYLLILELHTHLPTHTHTPQTLPSHPRYIHS